MVKPVIIPIVSVVKFIQVELCSRWSVFLLNTAIIMIFRMKFSSLLSLFVSKTLTQ